jgi:flagellar hook-associated protein FlgK
MLLVPSALPKISRRRALVSAAALAVLGVAAAGCADPPPSPDLADLAAQLDRARADSKLASDAAAAQPPQSSSQARALTTVASERSAHAQALTDELVRMAGTKAPTAQPSASSSTTTPPSGAPAPAPTAADVINALKQSAQEATTLADRLSGYRAGLVGSIAAACTAAYTVALGGGQ